MMNISLQQRQQQQQIEKWQTVAAAQANSSTTRIWHSQAIQMEREKNQHQILIESEKNGC